MAKLGHLPAIGESVAVENARLTVSGLDGRRVARLQVTPLTPAVAEEA
jgi:putative hemolysin